jgi:hypothetical protein
MYNCSSKVASSKVSILLKLKQFLFRKPQRLLKTINKIKVVGGLFMVINRKYPINIRRNVSDGINSLIFERYNSFFREYYESFPLLYPKILQFIIHNIPSYRIGTLIPLIRNFPFTAFNKIALFWFYGVPTSCRFIYESCHFNIYNIRRLISLWAPINALQR